MIAFLHEFLKLEILTSRLRTIITNFICLCFALYLFQILPQHSSFSSLVIKSQYPLEINFFIIQDLQHEKDVITLLSLFICFTIDPVQSLKQAGLKFYSRSSYHLLSSLVTLETHLSCGFMMSSSYVDHLHIFCLIVIYLFS